MFFKLHIWGQTFWVLEEHKKEEEAEQKGKETKMETAWTSKAVVKEIHGIRHTVDSPEREEFGIKFENLWFSVLRFNFSQTSKTICISFDIKIASIFV